MNNWLKRLMAITVCLPLLLTLVGGLDQKTLNALKVQHILRKIERRPSGAADKELMAEVTETELNAYIESHLAREKDPVVSGLTVTLLDQNLVRGKLRLDGNQLNLGGLFGDELDVNFKGTLHTRKGLGRIDLRRLTINGRNITPRMLDAIIRTADLVNGTTSGGIDDWYKLPKGIKSIRLKKGMALVFY